MSESHHAVDAEQVLRAFATMDIAEQTVGYGDRFPTTDDPNLVVHDSNAAGGIEHRTQSAAYGYDLSRFGPGKTGVTAFLDVLAAGELHPTDDYLRVYRDLGRGTTESYPDQFLHVWVSEAVLLACSTNPITGEGPTSTRRDKQGQAGYIGVGGKASPVEDVVSTIDESVTTKGKREGDLFY